MYRHLEKNNFVNKTVHEVFFDQSDVIRSDTGERALSLKKFVSVIMEKNLFSKETQNKFANEFIPDKEVYYFILDLKDFFKKI